MKKKHNAIDDRAVSILTALETEYPNVRCGLNFNTPFQLLVATMLSAQSTDKTVNRITEGLFCRYPSLKEFLSLSKEELMEEIKEIGLYRNKSKNILEMCNDLTVKFGGEVPSTMEELVSLPGVGRKTANVVLSNAFGIPAIAVDTHVFRVSNRIGLAESKNVEGTEEQLMKNIPKEKWSLAHHLLIWHGRLTCMARKPQCDRCSVSEYCKFYKDQHN